MIILIPDERSNFVEKKSINLLWFWQSNVMLFNNLLSHKYSNILRYFLMKKNAMFASLLFSIERSYMLNIVHSCLKIAVNLICQVITMVYYADCKANVTAE